MSKPNVTTTPLQRRLVSTAKWASAMQCIGVLVVIASAASSGPRLASAATHVGNTTTHPLGVLGVGILTVSAVFGLLMYFLGVWATAWAMSVDATIAIKEARRVVQPGNVFTQMAQVGHQQYAPPAVPPTD